MAPRRNLLHVDLKLFELIHRGGENRNTSLRCRVVRRVEIGVIGLGWNRLGVVGWIAIRYGRDSGQLSSAIRRWNTREAAGENSQISRLRYWWAFLLLLITLVLVLLCIGLRVDFLPILPDRHDYLARLSRSLIRRKN